MSADLVNTRPTDISDVILSMASQEGGGTEGIRIVYRRDTHPTMTTEQGDGTAEPRNVIRRMSHPAWTASVSVLPPRKRDRWRTATGTDINQALKNLAMKVGP